MKVASVNKSNRRSGFTLVELVVVVLIMGIIAAVALPKMATSTGTAKTNSAKSSLSVVRDAIELYKADNGGYPANTGVLTPYLKGPFPSCPIGNLNANVAASSSTVNAASGTEGWAYNSATGDFWINSTSESANTY